MNKYYKKLFEIKGNWVEWSHTTITFPSLENDKTQKLESQVGNDEVKKALLFMNPWKASGPD